MHLFISTKPEDIILLNLSLFKLVGWEKVQYQWWSNWFFCIMLKNTAQEIENLKKVRCEVQGEKKLGRQIDA